MNNRKLRISVFGLAVLLQLYVPANMIFTREAVLGQGTVYRFRTAPLDPSDPFRGKYITLRYEENTVQVENAADWVSGEIIYLSLRTNDQGYAQVQSAAKVKPTDGSDYVQARVRYVSDLGINQLTVDYPFDRYYMEESKAYKAEQIYRESLLDSSRATYAVVSIRDGEAVLQDVMIDGTSIRELVEANSESQP